MFPFNLLLSKANRMSSKNFEPLDMKNKDYRMPSPKEIKDITKRLTRCSKCHFLIFDNYWTDDIENVSIKLCPTCGMKI